MEISLFSESAYMGVGIGNASYSFYWPKNVYSLSLFRKQVFCLFLSSKLILLCLTYTCITTLAAYKL